MDITVPFLIVVIILCCYLLYLIAGIKISTIKKVFEPKEKKQKEEPVKEEKPKLVTQKSVLHKKTEQKKENAEEKTNTPSENAKIIPVFHNKSPDSKIVSEIEKIEKENSAFTQDGILKEPVVAVQKVDESASPIKPQTPTFADFKKDFKPQNNTFGKNVVVSRDKPFQSGPPPFGTKPPSFKPFGTDSPFERKSFGLNDDLDKMFDDDFETEEDESERFEKRVIGEKVATTEPTQKGMYWL